MAFKRNSRSPRFAKKEDYDSKLLDLARVSRMTSGGKDMRFRAAVVAGDKKGRVGFGMAKGLDVAQAVDKATRAAVKNFIKISIVNETIPHQVYAKFGAAKILLKPQKKGRGLVAGGTVRVICSLVGIKNICSKTLGKTKNKITNARAVMEALKKMRLKEKSFVQKTDVLPEADSSVEKEQ
jgi:small subunit ribosomal protein S5